MDTQPKIRFLDRTTPPHIFTLIAIAGSSALAMNLFVPSLPAMAEFFQTEYALMNLSITVYLAVNAVIQLLIGPVSDTFGRRPVILTGFGIFSLATVGCLLAPNIWIFLAFRMTQAVVVTGMVLSRAVVRDVVPESRAASVISYVTMGMSLAPMFSPMIGGFLGEAFGWQANFWLLLFVGVSMFSLVYADLGETATTSGLTLKRQFAEYPELLTSPRFWGYAMSSALSSGAFFAYIGGAPYVSSVVFGLDATQIGVFFGAPAVGYFVGNFLSGRFASRFGVNRMVLAGCIMNTIGMAVLLIVFALGYGSPLSFFGLMTTIGLGNGLTIPNAAAGALSVRPKLAGTASGLSGAIMIGGGAALSALAGALLTESSGAWPLLWIMLVVSILSISTILMVIRRSKRLAGLDANR